MKKRIVTIAFFTIAVLILVGVLTVFASTESAPTTLSVAGKNLSFSDSVYIIFYVEANGVDANDVKLLIWNSPQDTYTINDSPQTLSYLKYETIGGKNYLRFEYRNIAAKNMTDTIYARAYVPSASGGYYSDLTNYSVLQYAYNKLGKTGTAGSASLQLLLTEMLEYGAAAQTYFNHNTDRLATADFWQIKVEGGLLPDGCTRGLFLKDEKVLLTANEPAVGMKFSGWKDSSGEIIATSKTLNVTVSENHETYTAVFCAEDNSSYTKSIVAPTSINEGYTVYTCSNCGDSYKANYTPATGSSGFTYTVNSDGETCTITGIGTCEDTVTMSIPEYIYSEIDKKAYQVTAIGEHAFWKNQTIRTVYLPDSVTTIQMGAFSECPKLYEIQLPSNLVTIGNWAFNNCSITTDFIIPKTLTSIGANAFVSCGSLSDVYYEGSASDWEKISISSGNTALTSVTRHYNFGYANDPENYVIEKATSSITIDANRDASYSTKISIDHRNHTKVVRDENNSDIILVPAGNAKSAAWITYADGYLYFYAEIEDSTIKTTSGNDGDLFQIYIDYVNTHEEAGLTDAAYHKAQGTSGKLGWLYVKPDGTAQGAWGFSGVSLSSAAKTINGGYAVEVRVPFASSSVMSDIIGIGFEVKDDTDGDGKWNAVCYCNASGNQYYTNYALLPDFVLSENYEKPAKTIDYTKVNVNLDGYKDATYKTKVEVNSPWSLNPANSKGFGEAWMTQDGKGLYIFFDVIDANPYNNDDNDAGEGDRVQVYLDFANNHASNWLSGTQYIKSSTGYLGYIAIAPDGDVKGTYSFASHSGIEAITQKTAAGYSVELYVPFANSTVMSDTIGIGFEFQNDTNGVIGSNGKHSREAIFFDTDKGISYYNHYEWLPDYKIEEKPILTSFCMTDIHNNFTMLEPTNNTGDYIIRGTATLAIDQILATEGKVDVAVIGGDYMSDYPHWNQSGNLPYEYYLGYKAKTIETFSALAEDGKVIYVAGNHDYGQGELATDGPGTNGSYNSFDFYFNGEGMQQTMGVLDEDDMFWKIGEHTGEKYLMAYYYEVNGIGFAGLSPDPDVIWYKQADGMSDEALAWLDAKLDEVDPDGTKVIFVNCHYVIDGRGPNSYNSRSDYHAERLLPIFLGHNNLFHLYGHWETWFNDYTANNLFHYDKNGKLVDFIGNATDSNTILPAEDRGFNAVYMGHFRPMQGDNPDWFYDDAVTGYGGYTSQFTPPSTATPKIAQGMYIEVFEDRIVFTMKNFGILPGFETGTELVPYTVYLNK